MHIGDNRGPRSFHVQLGPEERVHGCVRDLTNHGVLVQNKATQQLLIFVGQGARATGNLLRDEQVGVLGQQPAPCGQGSLRHGEATLVQMAPKRVQLHELPNPG